MSRLEELLQNLCPDGVEYSKIEDNYVLKRGDSITKDTAREGDIPVIAGGQCPAYFIDKANRSGETIVISSSGAYAGYVSFWNRPIFVSDAFSIKANKGVSSKYLYHFLKNHQKNIHSMKRGGGVPHVHVSDLAPLKIPLPPLPVQEEIVRILDTFSALETELEAELAARTKQYEHYRQDLIFNYPESTSNAVERVMLGEVCRYSKDSIDASEIDKNSYVGVDNLLQNKQGKVASEFAPEKGRLIRYRAGDVLIGNIRPYLKKIWLADNEGGTNGDVLCIQINEEAKTRLLPQFLYQVLSSEEFFRYAINFTRGAGMPRGSKEMTMKFAFPVPPIEIQEQIVSILERFEALVNDLKSGLPAEITLRRKQYEYYRNHLFSFF